MAEKDWADDEAEELVPRVRRSGIADHALVVEYVAAILRRVQKQGEIIGVERLAKALDVGDGEGMMPYIDHPARQGETASVIDWLRYHVGCWMQRIGADLEDRALHPNYIRCPECGQRVRPGYPCDHIPF